MEPTNSRSAITEEAAHWWARLGLRDPRTISEADREAFTVWLRASPVHVAEFLRVSHVHYSLEHFKGWSSISTQDSQTSGNVVCLPQFPLTRQRVSFRRVVACAVAAIVTFLVFFAVPGGQVIQTAQAERRQVVLNDGSVVQLEPETLIRVSFGAHRRRIWLERGRALFRVAKDPERPFWVRADRTFVRAVGTEFGVEERAKSVVVTVAEGKVAVLSGPTAESVTLPPVIGTGAAQSFARNASSEHPHDIEVFVAAGQQVTVPSDGATSDPPVRTVDTSRALAWAQGRLVFENDTLADVVAQFNEYNRLQLRVTDPALAARRVTGVFDATDPETLLAFIRAGSHVRITSEGTREVLIEPTP